MTKHEPKVAKLNILKSSSSKTSTVLKNTQQEKYEEALSTSEKYAAFDKIDGSHPWLSELPENCITYPVRVLKNAKISYFNFNLAREMGLIPEEHPNRFTKELEEKIIDTFSLRIINEYDQLHKKRYKKESIKKNEYMATRYLQLQHVDKSGRTSGDGRGIWNGCIKHKGFTWDISSRGTGVTSLAPGAVEAGKPLETGCEDYGYGCGLAEMDELISTSIMSEIFHKNGISTERALAVIDLGKGLGIGVRAAPNLMRPAHIFSHLKQGNHDSLKKNIDYFIHRQHQNKEWDFLKKKSTKNLNSYDLFLEKTSESFAKFTATLDVDYIFAWFDWDGDNMLANAGIIDYGSIRQFGLRYDQYRYDDVQRFSTTLNEQRLKTRKLIQTYIQAIDFVKTKSKKVFKTFDDHHILHQFDKYFEYHRSKRILFRTGFDKNNSALLLSDHPDLVASFVREYDYFERKKTSEPISKVDDGVNRPALFNIRNILRDLPNKLLKSDDFTAFYIEAKEFHEILFASDAPKKDKLALINNDQHSKNFQNFYKEMVLKSKRRRSTKRVLIDLKQRSLKINSPHRITGNGIIGVVEEVLKSMKRKLGAQEIYSIIQSFINSQSLNPDQEKPAKKLYLVKNNHATELLDKITCITEEYSEDL